MRVLRPLYLQLHTWVKYKLAEKYHQPVPKRIPAHWINNRWSQEWSGIVEAAKLDDYFKGRTPEFVIKSAEQFLHRPRLRAAARDVLDEVRSLSRARRQARGRKTPTPPAGTSISATDIRSLQSIEPNPWWFTTAHHEFGHGYYFMSYTRPDVPPLLRTGANPAFHEGFGELIALAAGQVPYLKSLGVLPGGFQARRNRLPARQRARERNPVHVLVLGRDDALGGRHLREESSRRPVERALVAIRPRFPGHRAADRARRGMVRCRDQDPHRRHAGVLLFLRDRRSVQVPAPRLHREKNPPSAPADLQLREQSRKSATSSAKSW